jgi:hypothetical protein
MPKHIVKQGECLSSIAARHGFGDWKKIYDDPQNAAFRKKRPNPNLLFPGDEVFIPEKKAKQFSMKTGEVTALAVPLPRRRLRLTVLDGDDKPLANQAWVIEGKDATAVGTTDGNGRLEAEVPANLSRATLELAGLVFELELAGLDPVDEGLSGLRGRLTSLGYDPGLDEPQMTEQTRNALASFQRDHGLEGNGEPTADTLRKLKEVHGC